MGRNDQPDRGGSDPFDRRQRMKVQNADYPWNLREQESVCNRRCSDHPGHAPAPVRQKRDQAGLRHDERHQRCRSGVRGSLPSLYGLHETQEEPAAVAIPVPAMTNHSRRSKNLVARGCLGSSAVAVCWKARSAAGWMISSSQTM